MNKLFFFCDYCLEKMSKSPKTIRGRSILAVRIAKLGQLREPIRILLLTVEKFASHNIINTD